MPYLNPENPTDPYMQSRDAKLLGEATGEILRIVEAYTVGYLRDISVGSFISHHLARDVETVVADKLGCWQTCLLGEILAQYTADIPKASASSCTPNSELS